MGGDEEKGCLKGYEGWKDMELSLVSGSLLKVFFNQSKGSGLQISLIGSYQYIARLNYLESPDICLV